MCIMYRSAEEVSHKSLHHNIDDDSNGHEDDEVIVPAIKYANSGSSTSRGPNSGRGRSRIGTNPHHSEESSAESYDNVPLILGNSQQGQYNNLLMYH